MSSQGSLQIFFHLQCVLFATTNSVQYLQIKSYNYKTCLTCLWYLLFVIVSYNLIPYPPFLLDRFSFSLSLLLSLLYIYFTLLCQIILQCHYSLVSPPKTHFSHLFFSSLIALGPNIGV